jgi:hypothetical protein
MLNQLSPFLSFDPSNVNTTPSDGVLKDVLKLNIKGEQIPKGDQLVDSKVGIYVLDGNVPRTPGQYRTHRIDLRTKTTIDAPLKNTNETIHKSVRVRFWDSTEMLANGQKYEPLGLKGHWKPGTKQPWPWSWLKAEDHVPNLPEVSKRLFR